jgi:pimeloyl-ACP methyl ester carboxylesterase
LTQSGKNPIFKKIQNKSEIGMKSKWIAILLGISVLAGIYFSFNPEKKQLDDAARKILGGSYISLSNGVTHYKLTGPTAGHLVVLVHGGTIPIWTWDKQTLSLNDAGFRVLSYDQYGRGYSDRPKVTYDQALYKQQLIELVDKLELNQKFDLIGLSVGGGTAVNFTVHHPDRVRKLILISPLIENFKLPTIFQIPVIGEFVARLIGVRTIQKRFNSLVNGNPDAETYKRLFKEQTTYKGFQQSLLSMLRNDAVRDYTAAYRELGRQTRDILLIWGMEDTEITKEMIQSIQSFLPRLLHKPVKNVGHGIVFQNPDIVNTLIIDFL